MFLETADQAITASGWTEAPSSPQGATGAGVASRLTVFYRIATGTDATTTSDAGDHQVGQIIGITAGTFATGAGMFNTSNGAADTTNVTALSVPGVTTTVADCLIVAATSQHRPDADGANTEFSGWTNSNLTGIVEQIDVTTAAGDGGALGVATGTMASAGATGATTATCLTGGRHGLICLAVAPVVSSAIKTVNTLAKASIKTLNTLAIASVKTRDGLA